MFWAAKWVIVTNLHVDPLMASPSQNKVANTLSPYQEEEEVLPSRDKPQVSLFPHLPTRTRTLDPEFSANPMVLGQPHVSGNSAQLCHGETRSSQRIWKGWMKSALLGNHQSSIKLLGTDLPP